MSGRVRIITDGVADLPPNAAVRLGIKVVPIHLYIDGQSYRSDTFVDRELLYRCLQGNNGRPKTASPSIDEFMTAYAELAAEGAEEIIGVFLASNLSSLANQALLAARDFKGARIHFIETGQVSMGVGLQAVHAAKLAAQGLAVDEILPQVRELASRTYVVGMLGALEHLRASGRVNWAQARLGDLLQIKPLIALHRGEVRLWGRARTYRNALMRIVAWVKDAAPLERLALLHAQTPPDVVEELRATLLPYVVDDELLAMEAGPVFLSHIGPTGLGVAAIRATGAPMPVALAAS